MAFFVGKPQDGNGKVHFTPKKGKFEVKKEHGSLKTDHTGFVSIGTTEPSNLSETVETFNSVSKQWTIFQKGTMWSIYLYTLIYLNA